MLHRLVPAGAVVALAAAGLATTGSASTPARCPTSQLHLGLLKLGAGLGNAYYAVTLTNQGSGACTVRGFPGVSLVDADGRQIGPSARRDAYRRPARTVTLGSGDVASALLDSTGANVCADHDGVTAAALRVFAPGERDSLSHPTRRFVACHRRSLSIRPLVPGTDPPLD